MIRKTLFIFFLLVTGHWSLVTNISAQEITILYTGETHAMLYPCNCPNEPDGGISRRAALIKQLRKDNPHTLVLDSGGFFASGLLDEYTQNTELDRERTRVHLKAMELMQYDAVAIGDDEFNFGKDFLRESIAQTNLTFLSGNIQADTQWRDFLKGPATVSVGRSQAGSFSAISPYATAQRSSIQNKILPYLLKEVAGIKIGIIGVTTLTALPKAGGITFTEPKIAVKAAVEELKKKGANVIVLLSHLGESEDLDLINAVAGIDILIIGHSRSREESFSKISQTLVLRPSWQGRRLGKVSFTVKDNRVINYKVEELRLSDKIPDDPDILSILPQCFSDINCKREGSRGMCQNPGRLDSSCLFSEANKIKLLIITPKVCTVCNTETVVNLLKREFPGLAVSYLYYPQPQAFNLIRGFGIKGLPVYLLGKEIEEEKGFGRLRENLEIKGDFYMLKPQFSGMAYFLNRERIKRQLDLFISLYDKDTPALLEMTKEFNPRIHFLAVEQSKDKFEAAKGNLEVEEYLRSLCVQKHYPAHFWNYIICRGKSIDSSWWQDCLIKLDINRIRLCARSQESKVLLRENISLNKELQIMSGPTYLLDNQEIFSLRAQPTKEDLRKILKRQEMGRGQEMRRGY